MFANANDFALGSGITNWPEAHTHSHTHPVRGEHPDCSRNCQAGLTAGTPCCALRGLSVNPLLAVTLTEAILLGSSTWSWKLFPPFPGAHLQVSSPAAPEPQQGALCYHFCSGTSHPTPAFLLAFRDPNPKAGPNHRTPTPTPVLPGERSLPPACGSAPEPGGPAGSSPRAGEARKATAAERAATLLTLRSPRAARRGCGARCEVRDPGRCGPSGCWPRRGLGLGGGASLLGWERPAGQGGSGPAESPPRPTAAEGGPASPGRFHLRVGPCPRAPRRRLQIPAPAATRSQSAAKGRRAAAGAAKEGGGGEGGADRAQDGSPRPQCLGSSGPLRSK